MEVPKETSLVSSIIFKVRYSGLWHTEKNFYIHPLVFFTAFCYFGSYIFQATALFLFKENIELEFEIFSVISFCGMGILKLFSLCLNRELWLGILNKMNDLERDQLRDDKIIPIEEYESDNESENTEIAVHVHNYTNKFKRATSILYTIYSFSGVVFILTPFVEFAFALLRGKTPDKLPHILPSWNPLDNVHFICYIIILVCEAVAAIYCVCIHIAFDATVIGVIIFVCGQFSILIYQSERIGGKGQFYKLSKKRDLRAHSRIITCHKLYTELVGCINELDRLLQSILGFYFFLATLTLCTVAIRFKSEQMGAMQLVSLLQYMCATVTQLYIYCSFGDAVYNESSISAGQGPFAASVWCLSPKIRREVALLGSGMLKSRRLHAGPFNTVDLPSFIQIVRAAYSYYAVLGGDKSE